MELYVGMDVSLKETSICVVDGKGEIVSEGTVISEPSAIAAFIKAKAGSATRIGRQRRHAEGRAPPAERTVNPAGASRES